MLGIFGANGFIGRKVVERFAALGEPVRAISRSFPDQFIRQYEGRVEFVLADLRDPFSCSSAITGLTQVLQLVSTSSPGLRNEYVIEDIQNNVIPVVRFLHDCIQADVHRVIFISSGGTVYGPTPNFPIVETHPLLPVCSHGITKLIIEKYLYLYKKCSGLNYTTLRVSNVFGPDQVYRKGQGLIPAIIERYKKGFPIQIYGDGSARRDYIYIDDLVDAIEAVVHNPALESDILNIGSGTSRSVAEVIEAIEKYLGVSLQREYLSTRNSDVDVNVLDISRAQSVLGWSPTVSFEAGLATTLNALLKRDPGQHTTCAE